MTRFDSTRLKFATVCGALVVFAGCFGDSAAPPPAVSKTNSPDTPKVANQSPTQEPVSQEPPHESNQSTQTDPKPQDAANSAKTVAAPTDNPMASPPKSSRESEDTARPESESSGHATGSRVLILVEGGPVLLEFDMELDGRPLVEAFDEILAGVKRDADADKDGTVTWDELAQLPRVREGFLGNARLESERERREFTRQYDVNRNGHVDEAEWARVFRQGTQSGKVFSVENRDEHRDWNRSASPLFALLDGDSDQSLSAAECDAASRRLRRLDADDDERLQPYEVSSSQVEIPGMEAQMQRRSSGPYFAWHLATRSDWNAVIRACQIAYAVGGPLATGCFPDRPGLFEKLDQDGNGRISLAEFQRLLVVAPHVRVALRWGNDVEPAPGEDAAAALFRVREWSEELGPRDVCCEATASGARLRLGNSILEVFARESAGDSAGRQASQIVTQYDSNKNAYLDGDEIAAALTPLTLSAVDVDRDDNKQVTTEELAAVLGSRREASAAQVRLVASHPEDAVWALLDQDIDGQLSGAELDQAAQRLRERDRDTSGTVTPNELPEAVFLAVVRGEVPAGLVRPTPRPITLSPQTPDWFARMDGNGDGRLSRREFLGEQAQFDRFDADKDGHLSVAEATADMP